MAPVQNEHWIKPKYGFWTSTYRDGKSAWIEWCESEEFGAPHECNWFLLEPDPQARILEIATLKDLEVLLREYAQPALYPGASLYPDFERIAEQWDAIHLTDEGQWATRMTRPTLYGWDAESTLWFRWSFLSCQRVYRLP